MATFGTVDYDPDAAGGGSGITSLTGDVTGTGPGATAATIAAGAVTEAKQTLADNTTNNVSITKHGYAPKAPNDAAKFLDGTGAYSTPAGSGDMVLASVQVVTGLKTFGTAGGAVSKLAIAGSTSGSTILDATAVAGAGTVTLPTSGTLYGTAASSITSAQLLASLTDETGTGVAVFNTSPTFVTPALGTPSSGNLVNCTGITNITNGSYSITVNADGSVTGVLALAQTNTFSSALTATALLTRDTTHVTSGTAAASFGSNDRVSLESAGGTTRSATELRTKWTTATNAAEVAELSLAIMNAGTFPAAGSEQAKFSGAGALKMLGVGTAALPTVAVANEASGMYLTAGSNLGFTVQGTKAVEFQSNGLMDLQGVAYIRGGGTVDTPGLTLASAGGSCGFAAPAGSIIDAGINSLRVWRITGNQNMIIGYPAIASPGTDVASTLLQVNAAKTVASATSAVWDGIHFNAATLTLSGSTAITTATGVNLHPIAAPTISAASALTVTNAATVYIGGAPVGAGAGPATITNAYSQWVDSGVSRFDGDVRFQGDATTYIGLKAAASSSNTAYTLPTAAPTVTGQRMSSTTAGVMSWGGLTKEVTMLGTNTVPDNSGNCWAEPANILLTTAPWGNLIYRFGASNAAQPTTRIGLRGQFTVPRNYVAGGQIVVIHTATGTSGNIVWDFDYRVVGGDDTTSLNQAGTQESVTVTDAAPGTAGNRLTAIISPTAANFTVGSTVQFEIFRDGTDGADTMAFSSIVVDVLFRYTD